MSEASLQWMEPPISFECQTQGYGLYPINRHKDVFRVEGAQYVQRISSWMIIYVAYYLFIILSFISRWEISVFISLSAFLV